MNLSNLSWQQRIKRKVSLWGGSYKHPDGHLELDFESPAGINGRTDSDSLQTKKLIAYENRQGIKNLKVTYFILGAVLTYLFMRYFR